MLLEDLDRLRSQCGFTGFPVTETGFMGSALLGLVTKRDTDFVPNRSSVTVAQVMTPVKDLITAEEGVDLAAANATLKESKKGKLPILSKSGMLVALIARKDLMKNAEFPLATKDSKKRLMVAAAIGTRQQDRDRVKLLHEAGVDAI
eukprot:2460107-Amphidinium_carterae.1